MDAPIKGQRTRGGKRALQITLEYNANGLDPSDMLMEVIASRNIIDEDWSPEDMSRYLHNVGQIPFYILAGGQITDRYFKCLYAAEFLRKNPDFRDVGISELQHKHPEAKPHRVFRANEQQEEIDGTMWGGADEITVREQVETAQKSQIDENRSKAVPAEMVLTREGPEDAYLAKWIMAEKRAAQPRESWEGKCDFEFEQMIKYCYGWLRDIGEVPKPYPMGTIDLFWQRPLPYQVPLDEKTVARRNYITAKVMKFWYKSLEKDGNREAMQFNNPLSYRVVLAAKALNNAIEIYAVNWQDDGDGDEELQLRVRKRSVAYFNAHFPVEYEGAKAGPLDTLDPDYVSYVRLCRKYGLKEGTLLHEAEL